jgi:hypothetical protein
MASTVVREAVVTERDWAGYAGYGGHGSTSPAGLPAACPAAKGGR